MPDIELHATDQTMRQNSYTTLITVAVPIAAIVGMTNPRGPTDATLADQAVPTWYDCPDLDATVTSPADVVAPGVSVTEAIESDLPAGESFTDADAAALGFRLSQRRSGLPISEIELGSDV